MLTDWMNEECLEHACTASDWMSKHSLEQGIWNEERKALALFLSLPLPPCFSLSPSPSLFLSLSLCLPVSLSLFISLSLSLPLWLVKRVRSREREKERERERRREGEREKASEKDGEGGRGRENCYFFLKGMTGALAPFSYLVCLYYKPHACDIEKNIFQHWQQLVLATSPRLLPHPPRHSDGERIVHFRIHFRLHFRFLISGSGVPDPLLSPAPLHSQAGPATAHLQEITKNFERLKKSLLK